MCARGTAGAEGTAGGCTFAPAEHQQQLSDDAQQGKADARRAPTGVRQGQQEAEVLQAAALLDHHQVDEAVGAMAVAARRGEGTWGNTTLYHATVKHCSTVTIGARAPPTLPSQPTSLQTAQKHPKEQLAGSAETTTAAVQMPALPPSPTTCAAPCPALPCPHSPRHALHALLATAGHDDQHDAGKLPLDVDPLGLPAR